MNIYENPAREQWAALCRRAEQDNSLIAERVEAIVERVREQGDEALLSLAAEIDGVQLQSLAVSEAEFAQAEQRVSEEVKAAIEVAVRNIEAFHRAQLPSEIRVQTQPGVECVVWDCISRAARPLSSLRYSCWLCRHVWRAARR